MASLDKLETLNWVEPGKVKRKNPVCRGQLQLTLNCRNVDGAFLHDLIAH